VRNLLPKGFKCLGTSFFFNFSRGSADLISNFLHGPSQSTLWDGGKSGYSELMGGVPQGTVGGPKLLHLYINDLPLVVCYGEPNLYADDVQLLYTRQPSDVV
jgi:hypothetical protein